MWHLQAEDMIEAVQRASAHAVAGGELSAAQGDALLASYIAGLAEHTYLTS